MSSKRARYYRMMATLLLGSFLLGCTGNINKGATDVFMVRIVSLDNSGNVGSVALQEWDDLSSDLSGNGRYVVFSSPAALAKDDVPDLDNTGEFTHIFVRDVDANQTTLMTWDHTNLAWSDGAPAQPTWVNGSPSHFYPTISADGRYVVFYSRAADLVTGVDDGDQDYMIGQLYLRDRDPDNDGIFDKKNGLENGRTRIISMKTGSGQPISSEKGVDFAPASISADGRYVVFSSLAIDLVGTLFDDTNGASDVFLWDREVSKIALISYADGLNQTADRASTNPKISADGNYIVFESLATNLVSTSMTVDIPKVYICKRSDPANTMQWVGYDEFSWIFEPLFEQKWPSLSATGRFVTFQCNTTTHYETWGGYGPDTNGSPDIYKIDLDGNSDGDYTDDENWVPLRASIPTNGAELPSGVCDSTENVPPAISGDGRFVVFASSSIFLTQGASPAYSDDNGSIYDIFRHDFDTGVTTLLSAQVNGVQAFLDSRKPRISSDGRRIIFRSKASNLQAGDTNGDTDVFLWGPE